jgi:hypothetical protein
MRTSSRVMAGVVTLAMTGGILATSVGAAFAAPYDPASPPYAVDPNNASSLTAYDATSGAIVTGGSSSVPLSGEYFVASSDFSPGHTKAILSGFVADPANVPGAWSGQGLGASTTYPTTTAPASVNSKTTPLARGGSATFDSLAAAYPSTVTDPTSPYYQLYQLRVKTTVPSPQSDSYAYMDIKIDTAAHTWSQVGPTAPVAPAAPAAPTATAGNASATVTVPAVSGATSYTVTSSPGSFVQTGTGPSFSFTGLTNGTPYTFTATATNANGTSGASPASNAVTPAAPAAATTTTVSLSGGPYDTTSNITVTATVASSATVSSGTVTFTDNLDGVLGTGAVSAGTASITKTFSATGATKHVVTASYAANPTFAASSGQSQAFDVTYAAGNACADPISQCTDVQFFQATVAAGSLVISTPYVDAAHAFDLGTLALNNAGTLLSTTKAFGSSTLPAAVDQPTSTGMVASYENKYNGVTIVDRRPGDLGWTANLNSTDFQSGTTNKIDGHNLGFTGVTPAYIAGNNLQAGSVAPFQNPAAAGLAPGASAGGVKGVTKFASAAAGHSVGTVYVYGDMTLNAPTSTPAGLYTATVTFTIV